MNTYVFSNTINNKLRLLNLLCIVQLMVFCSSYAYSQVPDLDWAKGLEGFSAFGNSIAVDPTGNVYTTGYFKGNLDLDPGSGTAIINTFGNDDGYISKLDVHGNFVWGKQIGGSGWDQAIALALDTQNNIYVLGYFGGTANFGSFSLTAVGPRDIFVCKLDDQGNFIWAKMMPGNDSNTPYAIATDSQNNVVITGGFKGTVDFDPGAGTFNLTSYGLIDIFVAKLDPSGGFMWAKQMGGTGSESARGITVDAADNILLTGNFRETSDFDGVSLSTDESYDVFVCKLASNGAQLWVKQFEGVVTGTTMSGGFPPVQVNVGSLGIGKGIVTDNAGNVYITGYYKGNVDFDPGPGTFYIPSVDSVHTNIFISKLSDQGDFQWAKMIGNDENSESWAIDVNDLGNVYITGRFYGTLDFDPSTSSTYDLSSGYVGGGSDAFIGILDDNGNFVWAGQFKGSDSHINIGWAIKADHLGRIYTTGYFGYNVDFDPGTNVYILSTPTSNSSTTYAFVHKIADSLNASFTASNTTICAGDSIIFTDQSTGMGILSWNWTFNGGLPASASTIGPHTITFNTAGTYNITLEIEDDLTDTDDTTIVITVNPSPTASANALNTTICEGDDIELTAGNVTGATYAWSGPGGYSNTGQNPTISNATTSDAGTYTLTVTHNGCTAEDDVVITVNPQPTANASATNTTLCEGDDIELTATGVSGATYSWSGPNGYSSSSQNPVVINATSAEAGTYTLTVTNGGCSNDDNVVIIVNPLPTFTVNPNNPSCGDNNGEIVITPASGVTITNYSIDNGTTTQSGGTFSNLSAGNYIVYVKDNNGCEATQTESLSNSGAPVIDNIATTQTSCTTNNGTITITASGGTGAIQYSIDNGATFQGSGSFTGLGAGNYNIVVKDNNGCEANGTATINQMNAPNLTLVSSTDATCNGSSDGEIEVVANGGAGTYTYSWSPNVSSSENAANLSAGDYTITVTDGAGCSDALQVTISQPDAIVLTESITNADCAQANGSISLQASGGDGNYSYNWNPNVSTSSTATNLISGPYEVTVTDGNGCANTSTFNVGMNGSFSIQVIPNNITITQGESIGIHLGIDPGVIVDTIIWSPSEGLSCTDCINPTASPETSTTYYVEVINTDGCSAKDSVIITVKSPCAKIFVPTSFSPNGDGKNDLQCVMGGCITTMEFTIYDRWGEVVFYTLDQKKCWDGMFRGKLVQSGVYIYRLKATLENGEKVKESGNINVVR